MQDSAHKKSRTACLGVLLKLLCDLTEYQTDYFSEYQTECRNNSPNYFPHTIPPLLKISIYFKHLCEHSNA